MFFKNNFGNYFKFILCSLTFSFIHTANLSLLLPIALFCLLLLLTAMLLLLNKTLSTSVSSLCMSWYLVRVPCIHMAGNYLQEHRQYISSHITETDDTSSFCHNFSCQQPLIEGQGLMNLSHFQSKFVQSTVLCRPCALSISTLGL